MDYNMPVMTGAEVLRNIRDDRKRRDLPVVMITGEAYADYVAEVGESEIDAYILKPLTIQLIKEKVSYVVNKANNPPPMVLHLKKARELEEQGDWDMAIQHVELAMKANPKSTRPIRELGYYHYKKNDLKKAMTWFLRAAKLNSLDVFSFHYLGEIFLRLNDVDKASLYFEKAMKISPRQLDRGINFGKVLIQRNMMERATRVFDKVLALPSSTPKLKEHIADYCFEKGGLEYSAKLYEALVEEYPKRSDLFYKLGLTQERLGESLKAVSYFRQSADFDKENIEVRLHLAKIYLNIQKPILAEKPLVEILEVNREHEEARELLKRCY
jgi:tetratricopeptide (TPR) repeat protein